MHRARTARPWTYWRAGTREGIATTTDKRRIELASLVLSLDPPQLHDRAGNAVRLRRQPLDVLAFLAARAGNLDSKQALLDSVWPKVVVTEDRVVQCIAEIRQVLGDASHRIVVTEHNRGYRAIRSSGRFRRRVDCYPLHELCLGAQAGERRLGAVVCKGGFEGIRRAAQTPFNLIFEAR